MSLDNTVNIIMKRYGIDKLNFGKGEELSKTNSNEKANRTVEDSIADVDSMNVTAGSEDMNRWHLLSADRNN